MVEIVLPPLPPFPHRSLGLSVCVFTDLFMHACAFLFSCVFEFSCVGVCVCVCAHRHSSVLMGRLHFPTGQGLKLTDPPGSKVTLAYSGTSWQLKRGQERSAAKGEDTGRTKEWPI